MAKRIPTPSEVARKWSVVTPGRREYFIEGVRQADNWMEATKGAEERFETGIQEAIADKRFGRGVERTGNAGWQEPTVRKGAVRWGPGVRAAAGKFERNFAPFLSEIKDLHDNMPERFPKGSPENIRRVEHFAMGLRKKKLDLLGS